MRGDEVPDLGGRVAAFALCGEVFGDDAFGERLVYGGPHGAAFPVEPRCSSSMAAERIVAIGLAMFFPAACG